jgi:class 3 adenylate cyclase/CHAT domain-containing protein/tetratricopeptide (TPR) repeat protein
MVEDKEKKVETESLKMEQVLRERHRLEQLIEDKFRKKRAILFSDVCGYTNYMETWGDIAGRGWIQKHHDIVFPAIKENGGEILDVMGDGLMVSFPVTLSAVKASIAVQERLRQYNAGIDKAHQIHVKIGINTGEILVDGDHVAGDVVNVASRIQNQAGPDQVLVDKSVFEEVCGSEDVICRFHAVVPVKGKADPLELYRIAWQDEDIVLSAEPRVRAQEPGLEKKMRPELKVLQLEISQEEDHLKISATEGSAGEVSTIRHYEEMPIPRGRIGGLCREIVETLNSVNRRGRLTREVLIKLREVGQLFCDELFTPEVKEKVRKAESDHLILQLDDQLVHIPWELIHDGQQFLCQKFNMGRLVKTRQTVLRTRARSLGRPFKMLVLVDPRGDLEGAYREGTELRDFMDRFKDYVSVSSRSSDITADFIRQKIRNFDLIHFAGHAEYHPENPADSGWRLSDGIFSARDIMKLSGTAAMPALVFSNACQSARTDEWRIKEAFQDEIFGLANAFILSGVKHYIGTFWEILDEPSSRFALECYRHALSGMTVGEAVRQARLSLIKDYGEETIVWASYLLYGDPTFNYTDQVMATEAGAEPAQPEKAPLLEGVVRTREHVIDFEERNESRKRRYWWAAAAAVSLLAVLSLWVYPDILSKGIGEYEREALASFEAGDYTKAIATCQTISEKNPRRSLGYLILGNIHFLKRDLEKASVLFRKALDAEEGAPSEKAEALLGLGRIASIGKKTDEALHFYQQAAQLDPKSAQPNISQGMVLDRQGRFADAIKVLATAQALAPNDPALRAFVGQVREKAAIAENIEQRERIDKLVQELLESLKNPSPQAAPEDGWTSFPLTLWVMDFSSTGHCLREGEEKLIVSGIMDRLIEKSRAKLVERSLLDKLLEELKLGTSRLADQATALSIGKIMAARVILSGQVIYDGMQTQVALRLIETETGEIRGALNEPFVSTASPSEMTDKLSDILLAKLKALYPLRGKISEVGEKGANLNIGRKHGVQVAQQFRVSGTDRIIEIEGVNQERSTAKMKGGDGTITPGLRVEILSDGGK